MSTIKFHAVPLSTALLCLMSALSSGCHNDFDKIDGTDSATGDNDFFFGDSTSSDAVPTTSVGDPTDGGSGDPTDGDIDPSDFCKLHPAEEYPGFVFVCSGSMGGGINFDYFGDPDLSLSKYIPCVDFTAPPFEQEKPAGYVYSCFIESGEYSFGPDIPQPNGHQIDACCLRDSPEEAASAYCRIDGAEELCLGASNGLNALRAELPHIPALTELHQQLENLNKFLAGSGTQTSCAKSIATDLLESGDFSGDIAKAGWQVEHPQELDPEVGWPWFRELRLNIYDFQIDAVDNSGLACHQIKDDALIEGVVKEGHLSIHSEMGASTTGTAGQFSFRRSDCNLASCEFTLETFELQVKDFSVGSLAFTDVSVALARPAIGLIQADAVAIPENRLHLTVSFRLASEGLPMFEGAPVSVGFGNHGDAHFLLRQDSSLVVQELKVTRWPFEFALVSQVST